jgi:predicted transcriptional regulator of viral defense system
MKKSNIDVQKKKPGQIAEIFLEKNGYARTKELIERGIHQRAIKMALVDGLLIKIKNGLYRYTEIPLISNQSFIDISLSVPDGVICLLSALSYYELTTFNPTFISVAILRNTWKPKIEYPPTEFFYFSEKQFGSGIDEVKIGSFNVRIYCPEKTICDCFRHRNKLGLDIAKEGLTEYLRKKDRNLEKLLNYAEICRVKQLIQTWLNALI